MNTLDFIISIPNKKVRYPVSDNEMKRIIDLVVPQKDDTIITHIGKWFDC